MLHLYGCALKCYEAVSGSSRVYALTQKVHLNKGETQSAEKRRQGKSKLKVTTVAAGKNVVCHIGGVKRGAAWAVLHCVISCMRVSECDRLTLNVT